MKNAIYLMAGFITLLLFGMSLITLDQEIVPWEVPSKYEKMKNPIKADSQSLKDGKSIYNKHCKSCHGKEGLGDGSKAAQLDTPSGDFSTEEFHEQSDGALFYKTVVGREDMPSFKKKIPYEEDIWSVINFIRTFQE